MTCENSNIRIAEKSDIKQLSEMLYSMYHEVNPQEAVTSKLQYEKLAKKHIKNDDVWLDTEMKGFFIMRNESIEVLNHQYWNGVSVYIKPEYRKTNILKCFYTFMFSKYKGVIMGYTDVNSEHNKVMMKRHKLLGYVYELNRS